MGALATRERKEGAGVDWCADGRPRYAVREGG